LEVRRTLVANPQRLNQTEFSLQDIEAWRAIMQMSEDDVREKYGPIYAKRSRTQSHFWANNAYNTSNQPVVGVNSFEARAYCAWLSDVTGHSYRLPCEAEWEYAARGTQSLKYPWGNGWDVARCNTLEGRILRSSPVGIFLDGASPCGALDMAGNVWEWTSGLYQPYPLNKDDRREDPNAEGKRVLRGGSWNDFQRLARCAYRLEYSPGSFNYDIGFRLVCVPG
jgi:formylglycine-generating enzyme required for sulfatase activity